MVRAQLPSSDDPATHGLAVYLALTAAAQDRLGGGAAAFAERLRIVPRGQATKVSAAFLAEPEWRPTSVKPRGGRRLGHRRFRRGRIDSSHAMDPIGRRNETRPN